MVKTMRVGKKPAAKSPSRRQVVADPQKVSSSTYTVQTNKKRDLKDPCSQERRYLQKGPIKSVSWLTESAGTAVD